MISIELDMIQTRFGATRWYDINAKGRFPAEILCAIASKWWHHLFTDDAGTLWLVPCGGII